MTFHTFTISCAATLLIAGAAQSATLVNGSFDGPLASGSVPAGWVATSGSPDTNDVNTAVSGSYGYGVQPVDSPDGGTWVGFGNYVQVLNYEGFGQVISDFIIGQAYTLSWDAVNTSLTGLSGLFDNPIGIAVSLDGALVGAGDTLALSSEWTSQSVTFTATETEHLLSFTMSENVTAYLQIDNVALTEAAPVPVPAGLPLLLTGLGGLTYLRRRARR